MTDLRFTLRSLRRQPLFSLACVAVLALGIGVNAAIFTITDWILLRPLPYPDADRLVRIMPANEQGQMLFAMPSATAKGWQLEAGFLEKVAVYAEKNMIRSEGAAPQTVRVVGVSPQLLPTLGVRPRLGAGISQEDARPGARPVVVLSHEFWKASLGADPGILGRDITLEGLGYAVVGVMPAGFRFPFRGQGDLWVVLQDGRWPDGDAVRQMSLIARLPQGTPLEQLRGQANALARALSEATPRFSAFSSVQLTPIGTFRANSDVRRALWSLWAASGLILIIAIFNVANLFLVRGLARSRELAIRRAVGASRLRLGRLLLAESFLLAQFGGAGALLLTFSALKAAAAIVPSEVTFFVGEATGLDWRGLVYGFALVQLIGLLLGLISIAKTSRRDADGLVLRQGASSAPRGRLRAALVITEVALSLALLVGAGLLMRSFVRLVQVDPGFKPQNLVFLHIGLSEKRYPDSAKRWSFFQRLREEVTALPGVVEATLAGGLPPRSGFSFGVAIQAEGRPPASEGQPTLLPTARILPDFLQVLQIPLAAGSGFDAGENPDLNRVIIDRDLAGFLWGEENPVGRRFRIDAEDPWLTVAGVIPDLKLMGQDDRLGRFEILYPYRPGSSGVHDALAIRTAVDPAALIPSIRRIVRDLDPGQPIWKLHSAETALAQSTDKPRFLLIIMGLFAAMALLLSALGLYGVLSFAVSQRRRELGIRVALGARPAGVRRLVLRDGLRMALPGILIGGLLALGLSHLLRSLLFEISSFDPLTLAGVTAVMLLTAVLACYLPARKATRVDPVQVLSGH